MTISLPVMGAEALIRQIDAGAFSFQIESPAEWTVLPRTPGPIPCLGDGSTPCMTLGEFLTLAPGAEQVDDQHLKVTFHLRTRDAGQSMRNFAERERSCVWPRMVATLRCIGTLLPSGGDYESIEHAEVQTRDASVTVLEFRPRGEQRPTYVSAYVPVEKQVVQITMKADGPSAYYRWLPRFLQMIASFQLTPEK